MRISLYRYCITLLQNTAFLSKILVWLPSRSFSFRTFSKISCSPDVSSFPFAAKKSWNVFTSCCDAVLCWKIMLAIHKKRKLFILFYYVDRYCNVLLIIHSFLPVFRIRNPDTGASKTIMLNHHKIILLFTTLYLSTDFFYRENLLIMK